MTAHSTPTRMGRGTWKQITRVFRLCGVAETFRFIAQCLRRKTLVELQVKGFPAQLFARRFHTDMDVLWGAFKKRECDVALNHPPRLIIDGGANVGFTTVFYAHKYPDAQIVAVEPDPANCELLRRNCRAFPNVLLMQGGIWTSNTFLEIRNPGDASWSFQVREASSPTAHSMRGITIPEILQRCNVREIDILKLDVEGAEEFIFSTGCGDWMDKVKVIVIEIHNPACREAVLRATSGHSFRMSQQFEKLIFARENAVA